MIALVFGIVSSTVNNLNNNQPVTNTTNQTVNYGELLINSIKYPEYTLVRHNSNIFIAPSSKVFTPETYNTIPLEIIKGPGVENKAQVFINMAGKYLCDNNTEDSKVTACLDKTKSQWIIIPNRDKTFYTIQSKTTKRCLVVVGDKQRAEESKYDRKPMHTAKCNNADQLQQFILTPVTSKHEKNVEEVDKNKIIS